MQYGVVSELQVLTVMALSRGAVAQTWCGCRMFGKAVAVWRQALEPWTERQAVSSMGAIRTAGRVAAVSYGAVASQRSVFAGRRRMPWKRVAEEACLQQSLRVPVYVVA